MRKKKAVLIGILILAAVLIFAGCRAKKVNCCEPCKTTEITTEITSDRHTTTQKESTTDKCATKPATEQITKCGTNKPKAELTTKCTTRPTTERNTKPATEATTNGTTTKPTTEPTTKCTTTKPTTEPTTKCTTNLTTEPTTGCTTNPTTETTTKCTTETTTEPTTKCTTEPATETTTERGITPKSVQEKINCYIKSKEIKIDPTLTPETAEWTVIISARDEFLLTGISLEEGIQAAEDIISGLGEEIAYMYCYYGSSTYYPNTQDFYILYTLSE